MSFVPTSRAVGGLPPGIRHLLFWTLMIFLALVLWNMQAKNPASNGSVPVLAYSDFLSQVTAKNVETANVTISTNTVAIAGKLKQPANDYKTTAPRDSVTPLIDQLRQGGATVEVSEGRNSTPANLLVGIAPILLLVALWIFMMRQQAKRAQAPPNQPTPGALG
jgi:cell division protease FtsH